MGIYDRDYFRQERPGFSLGLPHSAVVTLILLNAAVWVADSLLGGDAHRHGISNLLAARVGTLTHPWLWWQFLTYAFVHDPDHFSHILFNMLVLWFLGRDVEELYGRWEFLRLYLVLAVVGGVAWAAVNLFLAAPAARAVDFGPHGLRVIGASGAVTGIVILYALNFPRRTLLFMFVLPMPAWVLGVMVVLFDIFGAMQREGNVASSVHLAGAAFAVLYFQQRWNFGALLQGRFAWPWFRSRGRLRIHRHEQDDGPSERELRKKEVDRILEKIHREGEGSLTRKERRILETASREYQQRLRGE